MEDEDVDTVRTMFLSGLLKKRKKAKGLPEPAVAATTTGKGKSKAVDTAGKAGKGPAVVAATA